MIKQALSMAMTTVVLALFASTLCGCNNGGSSGGGIAPVSSTQSSQPNQKDDHGDTSGFATTLNLGLTETGKIDSGSDVDYFVFLMTGPMIGNTYEFKLNASQELNIQVDLLTNYGIAPSIKRAPKFSGPIFVKITPRPGVTNATYDLTVREVTPAAPPAPPLVPLRFEILPDQSGKSPREVPATSNSNLMKIKAIAQVDSVSVTDLHFTLQRRFPAGHLNITLRDRSGTYTGNASVSAHLAGVFQTFTHVGGNTPIFHLAKTGDYAEIYLNLDVQGEDFAQFTTELNGMTGLHNGRQVGAHSTLRETVLVEALPDLTYLHPSSTISTVTSGSQFAPITKIQVRNNSTTHFSEVEHLYVYRMTDGDQAPLTLTQNGFVIANGRNESFRPVTPGPLVHYVVFNIQRGLLVTPPGGMIELTVEADLRNSHTANLEYQIRSAVSNNDNGQRLFHGIFFDPVLSADTTFTVTQQ